MHPNLARRWADLVDHDHSAAAGARLLRRWAEPHRRYHDTAHLATVLVRIDELAAEANNPDDVRLAAFFHDAVYDVTADDNEARSAVLAESVLPPLGVEAGRVARVARLVRGTATHLPEARDDRDAAVLFDADLAILASSPADYATYAAAIRAEYAHVPEAAFRVGRARVLADLLDRPALFWTQLGRHRWEAAARHNVSTELALLGAAGR